MCRDDSPLALFPPDTPTQKKVIEFNYYCDGTVAPTPETGWERVDSATGTMHEIGFGYNKAAFFLIFFPGNDANVYN